MRTAVHVSLAAVLASACTPGSDADLESAAPPNYVRDTRNPLAGGVVQVLIVNQQKDVSSLVLGQSPSEPSALVGLEKDTNYWVNIDGSWHSGSADTIDEGDAVTVWGRGRTLSQPPQMKASDVAIYRQD